MTVIRTMKSLALALSAALALSTTALAEDFRGGGVLWDFQGCASQGWSSVEPVRARLTLAASTGGVNSVSLFTSTGAMYFSIREPLAPTRRWTGAYGAAIWDTPGSWRPRPRTRVRMVQVVAPAGASVANATDLRMRVRIRRFNWMTSCSATVDLALARYP